MKLRQRRILREDEWERYSERDDSVQHHRRCPLSPAVLLRQSSPRSRPVPPSSRKAEHRRDESLPSSPLTFYAATIDGEPPRTITLRRSGSAHRILHHRNVLHLESAQHLNRRRALSPAQHGAGLSLSLQSSVPLRFCQCAY